MQITRSRSRKNRFFLQHEQTNSDLIFWATRKNEKKNSVCSSLPAGYQDEDLKNRLLEFARASASLGWQHGPSKPTVSLYSGSYLPQHEDPKIDKGLAKIQNCSEEELRDCKTWGSMNMENMTSMRKNLNQARSAATSMPAKTHTALLKAKSSKLLLPGFGILCWLAPKSASWSRSETTFQIRARLVPQLQQFDLHQPALLPGQFPQLLHTQKPKAKQQPVPQPVQLLLLPAPHPCLNSLQLFVPPMHQAAPLPPKPDHVLLVL